MVFCVILFKKFLVMRLLNICLHNFKLIIFMLAIIETMLNIVFMNGCKHKLNSNDFQ